MSGPPNRVGHIFIERMPYYGGQGGFQAHVKLNGPNGSLTIYGEHLDRPYNAKDIDG